MICEVCNKNEAIGIKSSNLCPASYSYCKRCMNAGLEPYYIIITKLCWEANSLDDFEDDIKEKIKFALSIYGISVEQFNKDLIDNNKNYLYNQFLLLRLYYKIKNIFNK